MWWFEVSPHCKEDYNPIPQIWYLDAHGFYFLFFFFNHYYCLCVSLIQLKYIILNQPDSITLSSNYCKHYKTLQKFVTEGGRKQLSLHHHHRALQDVKTCKKAAAMGQIHHNWFVFLFSLSNSSWWRATLCFCMHFIRLCMCVCDVWFLVWKAKLAQKTEGRKACVTPDSMGSTLWTLLWGGLVSLIAMLPFYDREYHCFLKAKILPILMS